MRKVYKRNLALIGILIGICFLVGVLYLFYDKVLNNETEVIVVGDLSVNFMSGNKVTSNGTYTFSVTNNASKEVYYDILIDEIVGYDEKVEYSLTSSDASVNITNQKIDANDMVITDNIFIGAQTTENFTLTVTNNTITSFKIRISMNETSEEYFYATILKNNTSKKKPDTMVGRDLATTNEGLIEDVDDYGITYYFRGNVTNNYVKFAGLTWRIIRINGDGTVRLILNDVSSELANYHDNMEDYENFLDTSIYQSLFTYYENNLNNYDAYIANAKFCNDTEYTSDGTNKIYNSQDRLLTNVIPSFNCLGDKYSSKIGLITADEVFYAGANSEEDNKEYYLYNSSIDNIWWTSTLSKTSSNAFYPFSVSINGKLSDSTTGTLYRNLRPVINLNKKIIVTGTGSSIDPYVIVS